MTGFLDKIVVPDTNRGIYWKFSVRMKPADTTEGGGDNKKMFLPFIARTEARATFL